MTSLKISTTEELLAVLPHQLGYHVTDSVAVLMVTDKVLGPVARVDLPAERDVKAAVANVLPSLLRVDPQQAMLVGYESVGGQSRSMMHALHAGLRRAGVGIIDHVTVRDGRWWGWCCRPADELDGLLREHLEGHPMADDAAVPAVAEFIARGSAPLPSRAAASDLVCEDVRVSTGVGDALDALWEEAIAQVDPDGVLEGEPDGTHDEDDVPDAAGAGSRAAQVAEARQRATRWIEEIDRAQDVWARVLAPEGERGDTFEASDRDVARAVRSLVNKGWRDALISWMSPVMFPLDMVDEDSGALLETAAPAGPATSCEESETVLRRLLQLARRVPDEWSHEAAAISTMVACVAWGTGNGSTAGDAITRALRVEPGYTLAGYVSRMVEYQLRPRHAWNDVVAQPRAS